MGEEAELAMREEAEEEASDEPADDLGRAIADAKRNCASDLEKKKLQQFLCGAQLFLVTYAIRVQQFFVIL